MELVVAILTVLIISTIINMIQMIYMINTKQEKNEVLSTSDKQEIMIFFDNILEKKFSYYLNVYFLANMIMQKEIEKKEIKKFKDMYYLDISNMINEETKHMILTVFTKKGLDLYIHQTFLKLLNKYDIKYRTEKTEVSSALLREVYKG